MQLVEVTLSLLSSKNGVSACLRSSSLVVVSFQYFVTQPRKYSSMLYMYPRTFWEGFGKKRFVGSDSPRTRVSGLMSRTGFMLCTDVVNVSR